MPFLSPLVHLTLPSLTPSQLPPFTEVCPRNPKLSQLLIIYLSVCVFQALVSLRDICLVSSIQPVEQAACGRHSVGVCWVNEWKDKSMPHWAFRKNLHNVDICRGTKPSRRLNHTDIVYLGWLVWRFVHCCYTYSWIYLPFKIITRARSPLLHHILNPWNSHHLQRKDFPQPHWKFLLRLHVARSFSWGGSLQGPGRRVRTRASWSGECFRTSGGLCRCPHQA